MDTNHNEEHNEMLAAGPGIKSISVHNKLREAIPVTVVTDAFPPRPVSIAPGTWKTFEPSFTPTLKPGMPWGPMIGSEIRGASYAYNPNGVAIYFNVESRSIYMPNSIRFVQTSERPQ